ncbi:MAG TPA: exosortase family protein XrtF [Flavobacteriales bacterium]|nr:exosortase family protein XrtF [Flavobacteriales bacterium]HIA05517.1 exosortase family protein XrtF [Flavobacteriales bacterium]HIO67695.1 exosortase family protein XrtF [Flavobacteriales bacterium]
MALRINSKLLRFLIVSGIIFIAWNAFYDLWLHPDQRVELWMVGQIGAATASILEMLGYTLISSELLQEMYSTVGIDGTHGVFISDNCSGISLMALFTGFILAYPGTVKYKLLLIPFGILTIHIINILRIVGLCIMAKHTPSLFELNHHYTFTVVVYTYIFLLWVLWVNKFANKA